MQSALWLGNYDFEIQESAVPEPGPNEVLVKVHGCGICGTDLHALEGLYDLFQPPRVIGHEYSGKVVETGADVDAVSVGDLVTVMPSVGCGTCANCLAGCSVMECLRPARQGGFTEYAAVPVQAAVPLPASADLSVATLLEPLGCCVRAMDVSGIQSGDKALVIGAGPIGLMLAQLAKRSGASLVLVSEPNHARRNLAKQLGADVAIDPTKESVLEVARDLSGGRGVDVCFEAAAVPAALSEGLEAVRHRGKVVMVGVHAASARLNLELYRFHRRELSIISTWGAWGAFDRTANWLVNLNLRPILSHFYGLNEIEAAFDKAKSSDAIKVVVGAGVAGR